MRVLLAAILIVLPAQAATPLPTPDVICSPSGWCAIRADTLKNLLTAAQKLAVHTAELRALCGWKP